MTKEERDATIGAMRKALDHIRNHFLRRANANNAVQWEVIASELIEAALQSDAGAKFLADHAALLDAVAWCYQLAGLVGQPVEVLDNLSALANGRPAPHEWKAAESTLLADHAAELAREKANHEDTGSLKIFFENEVERVKRESDVAMQVIINHQTELVALRQREAELERLKGKLSDSHNMSKALCQRAEAEAAEAQAEASRRQMLAMAADKGSLQAALAEAKAELKCR